MTFKIKANLKELEKLKTQLRQEIITKDIAKDVADIVVDGMKNTIESGSSPITKQRFQPYRGQYRKRIQQGKYPGKALQPVNLTLTGRFLRSLISFAPIKKAYGYVSIIGFDSRFRDSEDKERGHRDGANNQAKRPIIPVGSEKIHESIINPALKYMVNAINKMLSKRFR